VGDPALRDCSDILEVLGAYTLGAADHDEVKAVEEHVADCVRCWDELEKEQQTAALLSLAVPIEHPNPRLEERLIAVARRDQVGVRTEPKPSLLQRLRLGWPATAGALGAASVAAIVFSSALQMQVHDLRDENSRLSAQIETGNLTLEQTLARTDDAIEDTQTVLAVLADDSSHSIRVSGSGSDAVAHYSWSPQSGKGFIRCENMPALAPGKVYEAWISVQKDRFPIGTFHSEPDGSCQLTTDLSFLAKRPTGIGISIESIPGALEGPTDGWMLYAHFSEN
jgi:hypothetical protein